MPRLGPNWPNHFGPYLVYITGDGSTEIPQPTPHAWLMRLRTVRSPATCARRTRTRDLRSPKETAFAPSHSVVVVVRLGEGAVGSEHHGEGHRRFGVVPPSGAGHKPPFRTGSYCGPPRKSQLSCWSPSEMARPPELSLTARRGRGPQSAPLDPIHILGQSLARWCRTRQHIFCGGSHAFPDVRKPREMWYFRTPQANCVLPLPGSLSPEGCVYK